MAAPSSSEGDKILDLEREIDALRQAVDARDQFIATAGHELRNPMLPIVLATQRLIAMAERSQGNAAALLPDLRRLERLVDLYVGRTTLLLDISRITAGHQKLEPESLDLAELLRDIVASYADAARRAGSTVATDIPDTVPGRWDRLALRQVIENLVSNAIKYGDGKPIAVALEPRGETVRIVVKDNGIGIKEEDQARIFDRFERAVSRRRHGGFGIGLWLANELVTAMAGRITIESAAGDGSSFTVTLPVHHDKDRVTT
ncbi:MAG TPA: HAMP domain-containing sensor histidine kinase [Stellaceae bacterium]|nr:HAMP domain-containing sensor histidine kinase [Stellaceae bacterium]